VSLGKIRGNLVVIGYGSIARGTLPLVLERFDIRPDQVTVVEPLPTFEQEVKSFGYGWIQARLEPHNYDRILRPLVGVPGSFILNLSVGVSSVDLIRLARECDALYLDTCIEPWEGFYLNQKLSRKERSNYRLRQDALEERRPGHQDPTALLCMGANPGLASVFVKKALMILNRDLGLNRPRPHNRQEWAQLAADLGVQGIHIAERDTQESRRSKAPAEFVNTWSVDGFVSEGVQPAELGWGTFEPWRPHDAHDHDRGSKAAIYLDRPGVACRVWSWTPISGPQLGFLITHNESISIAEYFSRDEGGRVSYRPTVHYAYHPCDDAVLSIHELLGNQLMPQNAKRIMGHEIDQGVDALGVLLYGHAKNGFWYGSLLSIDQTRELADFHNATGLQVTAGILAGMAWCLKHPHEGIVEAEALDEEEAMEIAAPLLGEMVGAYTDWTPLDHRQNELLGGAVERRHPWAFRNTLFPH
jgi:homospermidine synthase